MRRRTHRAVLAGGVDRRGGAFVGGEMRRGPPCDLELGVPGRIAGRLLAIAVGEQLDAVGIDEHGTEGAVARVGGLGGEVDGATQVLEVSLGNSHG